MGALAYLFQLALRDSRRNRGRLFLFMSSIVLGVTALVAINSFNYNLVKDINRQSKSLLGADLRINANKALTDSLMNIVDSLPGERATELEMFSMALIHKTGGTQFVRIKAIEGAFPFYGEIQTQPSSAQDNYIEDNALLVDDGLMIEHGLQIGDSIKLGEISFPIGGRLMSAFGSISLGSGFAPSVYMPLTSLGSTSLIQPGSLVDYSYYFKLPEEFDTEEWENNPTRKQAFRSDSYRVTTIEDQKRNLNDAFSGLNSFLNLIALVALLLGCIGVASSVTIYIKSKIPSIAVLRCLGMKTLQAFWVYFIQISVLGFVSVVLGAGLGSLIQILLPEVLADVLPYKVELAISYTAILEGVIIGSVITSIFALGPLLTIWDISPLRTLRTNVNTDDRRNPFRWGLYLMIVVFLWLTLFYLTKSFDSAMAFAIALIVGYGILSGVASVVMFVLRRSTPSRWPFVLRQGIANLYRPNNQTRTLIVSIGLGTAILTVLFIIQGLLLSNVASMDAGDQPNTILYGIESDQKSKLKEITDSFDLPIIQEVPIVTMRLDAWQGRTKAEWMADTTRTAERWAINREARVSYRDTLEQDEELIKGELIPYSSHSDSIFISLEEGYAEAMDVEIGDEMIWNVQGAMIKTYIGSIRQIEFRSMRTRFFILFPDGVLERAPQFHVLVTKVPGSDILANYRKSVVQAFPNISIVDLGSILNTLNDILNKISYVIRFMAGFSILTGLLVLISSLILSKFQRIRESVLLRTIGARGQQLFKIQATEYFILGSVSAIVGIVLSIIGSYLIAQYQLELEFSFNLWPIIMVYVIITVLVTAIGLFNSREVLQKSPLEILRKEVS